MISRGRVIELHISAIVVHRFLSSNECNVAIIIGIVIEIVRVVLVNQPVLFPKSVFRYLNQSDA